MMIINFYLDNSSRYFPKLPAAVNIIIFQDNKMLNSSLRSTVIIIITIILLLQFLRRKLYYQLCGEIITLNTAKCNYIFRCEFRINLG